MRLSAPLFRLPVQFDAQRLQREAMAIPRMMWRPDRFGIDGYWSLNLVSCEGKNTDLQSTPMLANEVLDRCPYTRQVLSSFETPWAEVRFRWLEGRRAVPRHWDADHFWFERMRLHIPVVTSPAVVFEVDGERVSMREGECWLFDRLRWHGVSNESTADRIHLVMDTRGSPRLHDLIDRAGDAPVAQGFDPSRDARVDTERTATDPVLPPDRVGLFLDDLAWRTERAGAAPAWLARLRHAFARFGASWAELWARHGTSEDGWSRYRALLVELADQARELESASRAAAELELADRIVTFGRTGGVAPVHARSDGSDVAARIGRLRVEPASEYLLRLRGDELVFVDDQQRDGAACTVEELLLIAAVGQGMPVAEAAASVGLVYDAAFVERVAELVAQGILRAYPHEWTAPAATADAPVEPARPAGPTGVEPARPAGDPLAGSTYLERAPAIYIRLLERGQAGIWIARTNRFHAIEPVAVALIAAIGDGSRLDEALARASIAPGDEVDAVIRALAEHGLLTLRAM